MPGSISWVSRTVPITFTAKISWTAAMSVSSKEPNRL
jgi:hypothetical protein